MSVHSIIDARVEKLNKIGCGIISQANDRIVQYSPEISTILSTVGISCIADISELEEWKLIIKAKASSQVQNYLSSVQGNSLLNGVWFCWRSIIKDCALKAVAGNPNYDTRIDSIIGQITKQGTINNDITIVMGITPMAMALPATRLSLIISDSTSSIEKTYESLRLTGTHPTGVKLRSEMPDESAHVVPHPFLVHKVLDSFLLTACTKTDGFAYHATEKDSWYTFVCKFILENNIIYSVLEINKALYELDV